MELLEGATLREALRQDRFGPSRALAVMRGVCAAMDAGHRRQLLHRDLKPENIILVKAGDGETAKVLDFGVARTLERRARLGQRRGRARRHASATWRRRSCAVKTATPSSDVWALGVIAYEMLTGAHPFEHFDDRRERRRRPTIGGAVAQPLATRPPAGAASSARALAIESSHRPASAAAFLDRAGTCAGVSGRR